MIYLLNADVLINAERDYYPRRRVPEFWESSALAAPGERTVVTMEKRSRKKGLNRRIPQVCDVVGVNCIDTFQFIRDLDFRTDWRGNS